MFTEVLFIIAKIWKQPIGASVDEWINWYIQKKKKRIICGAEKELAIKSWKNMKETY